MPVLHSEKDFPPPALKPTGIFLLPVLHSFQTFGHAADAFWSLFPQRSLEKPLLAELCLC